jgi:hypothetical protein
MVEAGESSTAAKVLPPLRARAQGLMKDIEPALLFCSHLVV